MELSKNEAVFDSLNLSPQLFINEVLNSVDDLLDSAFDFFLEEASKLLKTEGTDRSEELTKGVEYIRNLVQSNLDQRLQKWEEYCLGVVFSVPEDFSLPETNESSRDDFPDLDALGDTELDAQLQSLRDKISSVGKQNAELSRELSLLESDFLSSNHSAKAIDEAAELYKMNDTNQLFQDMTTACSEFRAKLMNLKRKMIEEKPSSDRANKLCITPNDILGSKRGNGLFNAKLEDLQEFLGQITKS